MKRAEKVWLSGKLVDWEDAKVHILTHALHYATSVFEGIRCYETPYGPALFRPKEHIQRLFNSAKIYQMEIPYSIEEICRVIKEVIRANSFEECYVRPIAYYGYGEMGVNPLKNPVELAIVPWGWGIYLGKEGVERGIRCKISSWRRPNSQILPPLAKASANYANSVLAKLEALQCGYDEAIQLNLQGYVCEGTGENIFIVKNGILFIPPIESGALEGITQSSVIAIAGDMGMKVTCKNVSREELFLADEAFLTGTAAEIVPIRQVDERVIGKGEKGEITAMLQSKFFSISRGEDENYFHWLDFVREGL